jgi:hypothetical protein
MLADAWRVSIYTPPQVNPCGVRRFGKLITLKEGERLDQRIPEEVHHVFAINYVLVYHIWPVAALQAQQC